jgi:hypothetical protein
MLRVVFFPMGRGGGMAKLREDLQERHRGGRRISMDEEKKRRREAEKKRSRQKQKERRPDLNRT